MGLASVSKEDTDYLLFPATVQDIFLLDHNKERDELGLSTQMNGIFNSRQCST